MYIHIYICTCICTYLNTHTHTLIKVQHVQNACASSGWQRSIGTVSLCVCRCVCVCVHEHIVCVCVCVCVCVLHHRMPHLYRPFSAKEPCHEWRIY